MAPAKSQGSILETGSLINVPKLTLLLLLVFSTPLKIVTAMTQPTQDLKEERANHPTSLSCLPNHLVNAIKAFEYEKGYFWKHALPFTQLEESLYCQQPTQIDTPATPAVILENLHHLADTLNIPSAIFLLGHLYFRGFDNKPDLERAHLYLTKAASFPALSSMALFESALVHLEKTQPDEIFALGVHSLKQLVSQNYSPALMFLVNMETPERYSYLREEQDGFLQRARKAGDPNALFKSFQSNQTYTLNDLEKATDHPEAQFELSLMYLNSWQREDNLKKGLLLLFSLADIKHPQAMHTLGHYFRRTGGKKSAIHYFSEAYAHGHLESIIYLVHFLLKTNTPQEELSGFLHQLEHVIKTEQHMNFSEEASRLLGEVYLDARYEKKDLNKASEAFAFAIFQGNDALAQYYLGALYLKDNEEKKQNNTGVYLLELSAKQSYPPALNLLGECYSQENSSCSIDYEKAAGYFSHACKVSAYRYAPALFNLACLHMKGLGVGKNHKAALSLFHRALQAGYDHSPEIQFYIGQLLHAGEDVVHDPHRAYIVLRGAATAGWKQAQEYLDQHFFKPSTLHLPEGKMQSACEVNPQTEGWS